MTRVMVIGARGLLGGAIAHEFSGGSDVRTFDRAALDITNAEAVARAVANTRPDLIVNCAAFNDVDGAEDDAAAALATNGFGVRAVARAAAAIGCPVVHYSTDFVFDGRATRPYSEADEPHPRSFYGLSKLLGEWFAAEHPRAFILRVESLFGESDTGAGVRGSVHRIVSAIAAGAEVPVFVDRTVSPAYIADVAQATRRLVEGSLPAGLYHCVNSGAATWQAVAQEAARLIGVEARLKPMTLEAARLRAPRPLYSALSNAKLTSAGIVMPPWQDALKRHLAMINRPAPGRAF